MHFYKTHSYLKERYITYDSSTAFFMWTKHSAALFIFRQKKKINVNFSKFDSLEGEICWVLRRSNKSWDGVNCGLLLHRWWCHKVEWSFSVLLMMDTFQCDILWYVSCSSITAAGQSAPYIRARSCIWALTDRHQGAALSYCTAERTFGSVFQTQQTIDAGVRRMLTGEEKLYTCTVLQSAADKALGVYMLTWGGGARHRLF